MDFDLSAIEAERNRLKAIVPKNEVTERPASIAEQSPFRLVKVNLGSSVPVRLGAGYRVHYLLDGSSPGGELTLALGSQLETFRPGDSIRGYFSDMNAKPSAYSANRGWAYLLIEQNEAAEYRPRVDRNNGGSFREVCLLGVLTNNDPDTADPTHISQDFGNITDDNCFRITGWKRIRVEVLLTGTERLHASFAPRFRPARYTENGNSDPTGIYFHGDETNDAVEIDCERSSNVTARHCFIMDVSGDGEMSFLISQLTNNTAADCTFRVFGIE